MTIYFKTPDKYRVIKNKKISIPGKKQSTATKIARFIMCIPFIFVFILIYLLSNDKKKNKDSSNVINIDKIDNQNENVLFVNNIRRYPINNNSPKIEKQINMIIENNTIEFYSP